MKISTIIVNFHSDDDTLSTISDLKNCSIPKGHALTIYVVDNSRSVSLKKTLEKMTGVDYIDSPKGNIGFAAANNLGLKKALSDNSDILIVINNDTNVPKDFIEKVLSSPITDPKVGVVGGLIYFAKGYEFESKYSEKERGKVIWYAGGKLDWDNVYGSHKGVNDVDIGQYSKVLDTDFVTGCLFIVRAETLKKVGLFDERYCLYHEDTDLNLRIKKTGLRLVVDPSIKIWHKVAQSSGIGSPLNDYFLTRNRLILGMDYASTRTKFALVREAIKKFFVGTKEQKMAVMDFFVGKLGKGSFLK